jgi:hypothetical protein
MLDTMYLRTVSCLQNTLIYIIIVCKQASADIVINIKQFFFFFFYVHIYLNIIVAIIPEFPSIFSVYKLIFKKK